MTFRRARWYRLGLDAAEVRAFLVRIADSLVSRDDVERALRRENAQLRLENEWIKAALRRWQAEQRGAEPHWRPARVRSG